ncbi:hypothetical protein EGT07_08645 [Herbaspirillum sp. HC18]|nr:hypothetical protein EGT07_08645 [Herbaspirillum sp. HC18]
MDLYKSMACERPLREFCSKMHPLSRESRAKVAHDLTDTSYHAYSGDWQYSALRPDCYKRYLNRIQSSRRLERETQRNVELMWLVGRLTPDFKTIANFRKDNGPGIRNVCRQFIMLCRKLDLLNEATVAIDGSKFKAVNHRDKNFTHAKLQRRMQEIEAGIARYLAEMDSADRQEPEVAQLRTERLKDKIAALKEQMRAIQVIKQELDRAPDGQLSQTDPDARSMKTRGTGVVGYNVQVAVETQHHLVIDHEVTNIPSDRAQLSTMATRARDVLGKQSITAIVDRGYYNGQELLKCHQAGIAVIVPKSSSQPSRHYIHIYWIVQIRNRPCNWRILKMDSCTIAANW